MKSYVLGLGTLVLLIAVWSQCEAFSGGMSRSYVWDAAGKRESCKAYFNDKVYTLGSSPLYIAFQEYGLDNCFACTPCSHDTVCKALFKACPR